MTDPDFADRTYIEPLDVDVLAAIIERERPDALLPTLGGQTALNLAMALHERGVLERYGVELIGANAEAIATAEDREQFKAAMTEIGLAVPASGFAYSLDEAKEVGDEVGYPVIVRPVVHPRRRGHRHRRRRRRAARAWPPPASPPARSPRSSSSGRSPGWKEYELEVMRDRADNCVVVCSIENLDPMGVHTGDSITVAPAQTLSDVEYQRMRDAAFACIRRIGVDTGGSNIQFAVNPDDGDMVVIEMNPRVSRSSALASKATGFPIAKIAARLAVGYTLDEIPNDITGGDAGQLRADHRLRRHQGAPVGLREVPRAPPTCSAPACSRSARPWPSAAPSPSRCRRACARSSTAAGASTAIRPRRRSTSSTTTSWCGGPPSPPPTAPSSSRRRCAGASPSSGSTRPRVDPWFLDQILAHRRGEGPAGRRSGFAAMTRATGGGPSGSASPTPSWPGSGASTRPTSAPPAWPPVCAPPSRPSTPAAPSSTPSTPYHYSTYEDEDEVRPSDRPKVIILGSGPNRIGQGIEFDYCCVHASFALRDAGFETVMVNCNPETVSTDYDTSDRLYFEPLTHEDVLNVIDAEQARAVIGVIVSLGGQTPLKLAGRLPPSWCSAPRPESIDLAEDRERWNALCARLEIPQPAGGTAVTVDEALAIVGRIGYPALVRPSYVLGGRAMEIVYDDDEPAAGPWPSWPGSARSAARAACRPSARCSSTASSRTPSRSTSTPSATPPARSSSAASWSTSRRPACTPATAPASSRRRRCRTP